MDLLTPARTWATQPQSESDVVTESDPVEGSEDVVHFMPWPQQITMFLSSVGPIIGLVVAIVLCWHKGIASIGWPEVIAMIVMYALAGFGVTIGFHRLLTHRAFETSRSLRLFFAICGSVAAQGAAIRWTATHRRHHQTSDRDGDPHSPRLHGDGVFDLLKGMWHAHMGWLFHRDAEDTAESVQDLVNDPAMLLIDRLYFFWVFAGIIAPGIVLGWWEGSWQGFLSGAIWGGIVRICLMQHATWSINSVCHVWGTRPFRTPDHSANNFICAIFALGEGWHNNHHAFPTSARQGLRWWEFDSSWQIIRTMGWLGLVWNIRTPGTQAMQAKERVKEIYSAPVS